MEATTAQRSPAPWQRQRQHDGRCGDRARRAVLVVAFAGVTAGFAVATYRARHRPRDVAFLAVTYWLVALLLCLVEKLESLRPPRPDADATAAAREAVQRRRVRLGVWAVAVALGNTVAWRVSDAVPFLALKLGVWGVTLVALGFACYFIFRSKDGDCCDAEHGRAQADAGGRRATSLPEKASGEMSPEEKV
uniref:Uncharacterized protein n=1 Tax=Leersia perrieri TaxID=77586 RepID=A0A0D9UXL8_9ORYZ